MEDAVRNSDLQPVIRRLIWMVAALSVLVVLLLGAVIAIVRSQHGSLDAEELRVRRLVVVDEDGVMRIELGQDPHEAGRRSRAAGLWLYDAKGDERGGISTFDDGGVGMAFDAPVGQGEDSTRDRISVFVGPDGASQVLLTDNLTRAVVRLRSDGQGEGGVETYRWDMEKGIVHRRTTAFDGDTRVDLPLQAPGE